MVMPSMYKEMNRLSKHDVNKLGVAKLREMLPFILVSDGEDVALVSDVNNVEDKPKTGHDVNRVTELPLSKHKQATSIW
jgi:hypothetical protein